MKPRFEVFDLLGRRIGTAYQVNTAGEGLLALLGFLYLVFLYIAWILIYTFFEQVDLGIKALQAGDKEKATDHFIYPVIVVCLLVLKILLNVSSEQAYHNALAAQKEKHEQTIANWNAEVETLDTLIKIEAKETVCYQVNSKCSFSGQIYLTVKLHNNSDYGIYGFIDGCSPGFANTLNPHSVNTGTCYMTRHYDKFCLDLQVGVINDTGVIDNTMHKTCTIVK